MATANQLESLGRFVRTRRRELGLSAIDAAAVAGINRGTWDSLERGERQTRDGKYAAIEIAMAWRHSSIEAILEGRHPEPVTASEDRSRLLARLQQEQASDSPEAPRRREIIERELGRPRVARGPSNYHPDLGEIVHEEDVELWRLNRTPEEDRVGFILKARERRARQVRRAS